ncbi:MAG TPA: EI24 domain-containing protein [Allosphingosinicella sp.]
MLRRKAGALAARGQAINRSGLDGGAALPKAGAMLAAFALAFGDLAHPAMRRVLVKSLAVTILIFAALAVLLGWLLTGTNPCGLGPLSYECRIEPGSGALLSLLLGLVGLWFLFPAVAIGVIGLFADEIVEAVEARHYPHAAGQDVPLRRSLRLSLGSFARLILWNLAAAPFYLILMITAVGPLILFSLVNALVLGRDLGEMVAARHYEGAAMKEWLAATRLRRATLGLGAAWLFLIPFANLLAPLLGAAAATHMFHRGKK